MSEKKEKHPTEIFLRSYSKILFFYPLLISSLVLWFIQALATGADSSKENISILGSIWFIVFFTNIFVTAFDFSSSKFFILILLIFIVSSIMIFIVIPNLDLAIPGLYLGLPWQFFMVMTVILTFILFLVFLSARFDYYKIERNEIYHKSGIFSTAERFPVKSLRFRKEIPDVFEFFMLRAGKLTIMPGKADEIMILDTVLNINKKQRQLDYLLSHVSVDDPNDPN